LKPDRVVEFQKDSTATLSLISYQPNHLKYKSSNKYDGLAIFSEMYYPHGWTATIDGKEMGHFKANYALRAMEIPAGKHEIEFKFEPTVVKKGSSISLVGTILFFLLFTGGVFYELKYKK